MLQKKIRIATRKSPLAIWQAKHIAAKLKQQDPEIDIELIKLTTSGDRFLKDKLLSIGGKGLFVKELEDALRSNRADIAVHSMKDVPFLLPPGLIIAAINQRDNPFDALICPDYKHLAELPYQAHVGTSSLRRQSQLLAQRPDLKISALRGNIHTRLQKLDERQYDAIILAVSGLHRMNLQHRIAEIIPENIMLPACGQGALGIECRENDTAMCERLSQLNDKVTATCVNAERTVNTLLGGNCHVPLAVYATYLNHQEFLIQAKVASPDGKEQMISKKHGTISEHQQLASQCAEHLLQQGAEKLLRINIS